MYMLRVHDQAKQAHTLDPPFSITFSKKQPFGNTGL
jgi:hypothetical protein